MDLKHIYLYPVKSCRGHAVHAATLRESGLHHDRRAMLIDADNQFISLRSHSRMALIEPYINGGALALKIGGQASPAPLSATRLDAGLKEDVINVRLAAPEVNGRLSAFFGEDIRLVIMDDKSQRPLPPELGEGDVNLADNTPLSILNTASLKALSEATGHTLNIEQFRPNLVIQTETPWAEDSWKTLQIGDAVLDIIRPISRCKIITLDPETGHLTDPDVMRALIQLRKSGDPRVKGVLFGAAALPRVCADINVGAAVTVTKTQNPWPLRP